MIRIQRGGYLGIRFRMLSVLKGLTCTSMSEMTLSLELIQVGLTQLHLMCEGAY